MNTAPKSKFDALKKYIPRWDRRLKKLILAAVIFAIIYTLLVLASMPARVNVELGKPSPKTIYAPRDTTDDYATELLRQAAAEEVKEVFDYNESVLEDALDKVDSFFNEVYAIGSADDLSRQEKITVIQELLDKEMPVPAAEALLTDQSTLEDLRERLVVVLTDVLEQGVKIGGLETAQRHLNQEVAVFPFSAELRRAAEKLIEPLVQPNMISNPEATERNREAARQAVEPVLLLRNTLIISEGEPVTEKHMAQLESFGLLRGRHADYPGFIGLFLILLILFVMAGIYLSIFVKNVYENNLLLSLVGLVAIITLAFAIVALYFSGYLIPVAMGVILITVMFGYRMAILMNLILALMVGLITGGDFNYILVAMVGGMVAIYAVSKVSQRSDLAKSGLYVAATNTAVIISGFLFLGNLSLEYGFLRELGYALVAGIGNGLLSSIIAIGLLPYLESGFGVTTSITLLELSNTNHPLLRRLLGKAPGTYHHSMMVCNLADAAAEAVGADNLLTRVGAYYHDIGKLKRPYFFTENQFSGRNPHQRLSPNLSALVIGSHTRDGVELGRKHRLPTVILDIIRQHHGTSLISFFYQKALENGNNENISMEKFRYEGPLPQTKEAAIIMLADAVEAGVRAMAKPVSTRVESLIRRIIKEKLSDGQMDECNLTMREFDQIGDAFINIMNGIYHSRIEYPETDLKKEFEGTIGK